MFFAEILYREVSGTKCNLLNLCPESFLEKFQRFQVLPAIDLLLSKLSEV